jgi:hypothetical protein
MLGADSKFPQSLRQTWHCKGRGPVNFYPIICDKSIDRKLEAMIREKGDAVELVLDCIYWVPR